MTRYVLAALAAVLLAGVALAQDPVVERVENRDAAGRLVERYTTVDGTRDGLYERFHENGKLAFEGTYVAGLLQGPAVRYYDTGVKWYEGTFDKGRLAGPWTSYYDSGQVYGRGTACGNGRDGITAPRKTGPWTWYHPNGKPSIEASFVDDVIDGPSVIYYANGARRCVGTFDMGRLTGPWTSYHDNGQVFSRGNAYGNGRDGIVAPMKTGPWIWFYSDGKPSFEGTYVDDVIDGRAVSYHKSGGPCCEGRFVEGVLRGPWTQYHENGRVRARGIALGQGSDGLPAPRRTGRWTYSYANGNKEAEGRFFQDRKIGPWVYWNEDGSFREVMNHFTGTGEQGDTAATEDPDTGETTYSVENPDGSRTRITVDRDGRVVGNERIPAPGEAPPSVSYTDPATGTTISVTTDEDGDKTVTVSTSEVDEAGTRHVREEDGDGTTRDITIGADGTRTVRERRPDDTVVETTRDAEGNVRRVLQSPDGTSKTFTRAPDGRQTLVKRDADGDIVLEATRDPSGVEERTYPDGSTARRHRDEDGHLVETTTDHDGSRTRTVRDVEGNVLSTRVTATEREAGQAAYEDVTGGRHWDDLGADEKKAYADMEERLEGTDVLDAAREKRRAADRAERDADREEAERELATADDTLSRPPTADQVPRSNRLLTDEEDREASMALKGLEWMLNLPDAKLKAIQEELTEAIENDPALVKELLSTRRQDLVGFLNRNPGIMKKWEEKVKPTLTAGTSVISSALSVSRGIDQAREGKYVESLQSFLEAGAAGLKSIPPGELTRLQRELGRSPAPVALAVKDLIGFGHEAFRDTSKTPRNWGKMLKDGVGMLNNLYQSIPDSQRRQFIERQSRMLRQGLGKVEDKTPGAKAVLGLIDAAPEVWKLYSEWDTDKRWVNISNLAQKLGPKVVGALVKASTKSDAAAEVVETAVQLGADYMGHLGAEARKATEAAMTQGGADSASYARLRQQLDRLAREAGMSARDAQAFEFMSNVASGQSGRLALSEMRSQGNLLGVREAMQAWRRVNAVTGRSSGVVNGFYDSLADRNLRRSDDEAAYQTWVRGHIHDARTSIAAIDRLLPEYARGSAARKYLSSWRHDLQGMVRTFG